ncbi:antitoxin Xre-like helix-turn-helix domain-containing protein, partial [Acidocella aminolytica]
MSVLSQIIVASKPFSPAPITAEEAGAMFRTALNLFRLWGVTDDQAAIILDLPRRTFARWKASEVGRIGRDGKAKLSNILGIHKALRIIFKEP